ncbi:MAG: hypothetical protein JWM18_2449 [Chloroflexi bacterium]|nr:hypothetical protein [Chloroflexota bacterium]
MTETTSMPAAPPTMPSNLSVVAVYDDMKGVEEALRRLADAQFPMSQVSIVGQDLKSETQVNGFVTTGDVIKKGSLIGAWSGGLFGLLAGTGLIFAPGLLPVFVLGPLAATAVPGAITPVAATVVGAAEGTVYGGVISAVLGRILETHHVAKFAQHLEAGRYLLVVHGSETEVQRARQVLEQAGGTDVTQHDAAAAA